MSVTPRREGGPMERHQFVEVPHVHGCRDCGQDANAPVHNAPVVSTRMTAMQFADYARQLGAVLHDLGLRIPSYRGTRRPDDTGVTRWIKRNPSGPVVSVLLVGREPEDVKRDMRDGACEANNLHHDDPRRWTLHDRMEGA